MDAATGRGRARRVIVLVLLILAAACGAADNGQEAATSASAAEEAPTPAPDTSSRSLRLGMAIHNDYPTEQPSAFWDVVALGAIEAAEDLGVELKVRGDLDPNVQARLVETFVADGVDGLIVSLAYPESMRPELDRAAEAGVPVITFNSGMERYRDTAALTHVGQAEFEAGRSTGDGLNTLSLRGDIICFVHEFNNIGLEERCDGVADTYAGGETVRLRDELFSPDAAETISLISGALESGNYSAVVTLDHFFGQLAVDAARAAQVDVVITTFDFTADIADTIRSGDLAFTVDQRPYLQGSLPVRLLTDYLRDGTPPDRDGPVETGPFVIDSTNVDAVVAEMNGIAERLEARFGP